MEKENLQSKLDDLKVLFYESKQLPRKAKKAFRKIILKQYIFHVAVWEYASERGLTY